MPAMTINVAKTSEAEWMASETMAAEWPKIPAMNLPRDRNTLTAMLYQEMRMAIFSRLEVTCSELIKTLL